VLEIGSEAAVLVIDLDAVGGAGILDATKLIVRLRSARAYKHLFALIVIEQSTEGLLMQLEAELSIFHNSVGDDRNGDHLTISCVLASGARGQMRGGSMMTYKTCCAYTIMRVAGSATSAMRKPQIRKRVRNDEA
jgi:hypothetical protein